MFTLFFALLALTAFFNLAEMALVAARASKPQSAENAKAAESVLTLKKQPGLFLAAIRAGDLATDLLAGAFVVTWIEDLIRLDCAGSLLSAHMLRLSPASPPSSLSPTSYWSLPALHESAALGHKAT
jgi:CBS domain containing-hemolysin-like protein